MKDKHKQMTIEIADILQERTMLYFIEKMEDEENTSDLINLVISSHLSSMFTLMTRITDENKEMRALSDNFIEKLKEALININPITHVEMINE